jgi:hypothetical protein
MIKEPMFKRGQKVYSNIRNCLVTIDFPLFKPSVNCCMPTKECTYICGHDKFMRKYLIINFDGIQFVADEEELMEL